MKTRIHVIGKTAMVCILLSAGCSQESRDEAINRLANSAKELNATGKGDQKATPDIVKEEMKKENDRQNTQWTPRNQKLHPLEYCQAQLEALDAHQKSLEVTAHKIAVMQNEAKRKQETAESLLVGLNDLLARTKKSYREAEASGSWPIKMNGYGLSKEKAQSKIIEIAERISTAQREIEQSKLKTTRYALKFQKVGNERKKLAALRTKIEETINDLTANSIVEDNGTIAQSLGSIQDSISALASGSDDVSVEDLLSNETETSKAEQFEKIMAQ